MADSNSKKIIDTGAVDSAVTKILAANTEIDGYLDDFKTQMKGMTDWVSEVRTEFDTNAFNQLEPKFAAHSKMITDKMSFLKQYVKESHEQYQNTAKQNVGGLAKVD